MAGGGPILETLRGCNIGFRRLRRRSWEEAKDCFDLWECDEAKDKDVEFDESRVSKEDTEGG